MAMNGNNGDALKKVAKIAKKATKLITKTLLKVIWPILIPIILIFILIVSFFSGSTSVKASTYTNFSGFVGASTQEKVWWALRDEGFSEIQVAAVMGNIEVESAFDSTQVNKDSGAKGLCQWIPKYLGGCLDTYANDKDKQWQDENLQIEFLVGWLADTGPAAGYIDRNKGGLQGNKAVYWGIDYEPNSWRNYKETGNFDTDIDYSTRAYYANYETGGQDQWENGHGNRVDWAKEYYKQLHGQTRPVALAAGNELDSNTAGIKGYYTSSSGKTYTEYWQNIPESNWYWTSGCFHCSLATAMSGFGSKYTPDQLTNYGVAGGYESDAERVGCSYPHIQASEVKNALQKGNPVMMEIPQYNTLTTDNGSHTFNDSQHWVVLLDYAEENGTAKAYVHDPWQGEACYGWGNLTTIVNVGSSFIHIYKN